MGDLTYPWQAWATVGLPCADYFAYPCRFSAAGWSRGTSIVVVQAAQDRHGDHVPSVRPQSVRGG